MKKQLNKKDLEEFIYYLEFYTGEIETNLKDKDLYGIQVELGFLESAIKKFKENMC
jgi:hypothetical protein